MSASTQNLTTVYQKGFVKGYDPRRGHGGGRPHKLVELERILDEHREPAKLRETLDRLRELAFGEPIMVRSADGETMRCEIRAHPGFMKLYLDRLIGPVSDDNSETLRKLAAELVAEMVSQARANRESREIHDPAK